MGRKDQNNRKGEQNQLINRPIMPDKWENQTLEKKPKRDQILVAPGKSIIHGIQTRDPRYSDHGGFKPEMMNGADPESLRPVRKRVSIRVPAKAVGPYSDEGCADLPIHEGFAKMDNTAKLFAPAS